MIRIDSHLDVLDAAVRRGRMRPDYTLPLRLQSSRQSPAVRQEMEIRRLLWMRALSDGWIWRRAFTMGLLVGMMAMMLDMGTTSHRVWGEAGKVLSLGLITMGVGVISATAARVRGQMMRHGLSIN